MDLTYDTIEKVLDYLDKKSVFAFLFSGKSLSMYRIYIYRRFLFDIRHMKYLPPEFKNEVRNLKILDTKENLKNYPDIYKIYDIYYSISRYIDPNYKKLVRSMIIDIPTFELLTEFVNLETLIICSDQFNQKIDWLPSKTKKIIIHSLKYNQHIDHLFGQVEYIEINSPIFQNCHKSKKLEGTYLVINGKAYHDVDFKELPIFKNINIHVE